ncbi:MAG: guanylate kinase [Endomicrobium sp.]|jgi:guanylate kinase|nr:guanylate kinase [Endomicrobium sp.]
MSKTIKKLQKGSIIVVSAPSGAGKTSICDAIIKEDKNTIYSISATTRLPRSHEKNGIEYFFVSETKFKTMIKEEKFAEWAKVHGNYYGTLKSFLDKTLKSGKNILLDIDVQGGINIKRQYPQACMIFIMAPDLKTIEKRLRYRNTDSDKVIKERIKNAKKELKSFPKYEYLVINDNFEKAVKSVSTIIKSLEYKIKKGKKYF